MTIRHLYPAVEPSLNLDFANSKKLDSRITFTRGSTATYTDESGIIRTAAQDEARFDHDGDGNSLGLLIEESRTNVITYSTAPDAQFSQDSANFSYTFNQPAPDGTSTAYLLVNTSNTSNNRGGQFVNYATIPTTGKIVVSVFVKPVGAQVIHLGGDNNNQGYYGVPMVSYNFTTSPPTANIGSTQYGYTVEPSIQNAGNGWYRLIEVIDLTNATAFNNGRTRGPRVCNKTPGTSTYVWGYQIETGSFPTSYIPTSGSTVTRSADVASITGTNFSSWYNQSEGTLYQDCTTRVPATALNPDVGVGAIMTASGNVQLGFYQVLNTSNLNAVVYQTATAYSANLSLSGAWTQNVPSKAALAYKQNSFAASADGATPQTDSSGIVPIPNALDIGQLSTFPSNHIGAGTFARLTYYPVRLPDTTLQALTL